MNLRNSGAVYQRSVDFRRLTDFWIGGWLVNELIRRGYDSSRVRQTVLVVGTAFGLGILGAAHAHTPDRGNFLDQHFTWRSRGGRARLLVAARR